MRLAGARGEHRDGPVGPLRQRVHCSGAGGRPRAPAGGCAFSSCSSVDFVDRVGADVAVDAGVDRAVGLAGAAGDRGDQRVALRAQPLAALERASPARRGRRRGRRRERRERGRAAGGAGSANSCSASPGCVVCSTSSSRRALDHSARNASPGLAALAALGHLLARRPSVQRVVALLLDLHRELLQPRVGRQEDVAHLILRRRRAADEAPDDLAEEQLGARGRGVDADAQARDVDALGDHQHRDEPRRRRPPRTARSARTRPPRRSGRSGRSPVIRASRSASFSACSLSIATTSPPASGCSPARSRRSSASRVAQDVGDPVAVGVERGAQAPRGLRGRAGRRRSPRGARGRR